MSKSSVYSRARAVSAVKTTEKEYDIREDEEQQVKEQDTLQLLVTAGYFRARIKGLSTFDKVIGGMTWCILGCSVDIEIDLLYNESANIGKKIALTEKIVRVLKRMKCPHRIEPHQIQGSDFVHIFPVVQWLVKQAFGRRDERVAALHRLAVSNFDQTTQWSERQQEGEERDVDSLKGIREVFEHVQRTYRPTRKYRKPDSAKQATDEFVSVQTTLLEYGRRGLFSSAPEAEDQGAKGRGSVGGSSQDAAALLQQKNQARADQLMSTMTANLREGKLATSTVTSILSLQSEMMQQAVDEYDSKSANLANLRENLLAMQPQQQERWLESVRGQLHQLEARTEQLSGELAAAEASHATVREAWLNETGAKRTIEEELAELERLAEQNSSLLELQQLIVKHDEIKTEEQDFKAKCREEQARLEGEISRLKESSSEPEVDEEQLHTIRVGIEKETERTTKARIKLATKSRQLALVERQLDDIPSQWETQQYQRRFLELYEQIGATYRENKQLYDMYNTEESVRDCLQREVNLLNSIHDNYEKARTSSGRDQLLQQMEQITASIKQLKLNGEVQKEQSKAAHDQKKEEHIALVEKGRQYARLVKEFQEACSQQHRLLTKAEEMGLAPESARG